MRRWIAPVFLTHEGCPYRCIFCNQHQITGTFERASFEETRRILDRCFTSESPRETGLRQIAFYGGSFTGLDPASQEGYLLVAREYVRQGRAHSVRVSVRPDQLSRDALGFLHDNDVRTVEIGVQSLCDKVLEIARRGHTAQEALSALSRAKDCGMEVGAQIMVGLPGDTGQCARETVKTLIKMNVDFVRIYPVIVLRNTVLESMFREGMYRPLELEEARSICKDLVIMLEEASIRVIRIGLQDDRHFHGDSPAWIAGPFHPSFGHLVRSAVFLDKAKTCLQTLPGHHTTVSFSVHPHDRSTFQGHRKENIVCLLRMFNLERIGITEDSRLPRGSIRCMAYA